ncbi:MAG: helix-turn-helix domain-containing protein [Halioglobus sp.]|jgi:DNA-binding HxlR family transcriptional regulator|uniref:winged helix-turn-helix transcriptional regulator n=1 Tax=Halioglobus sp. Uisw_031 TaxID=3230977 RepID=UPI00359208D6
MKHTSFKDMNCSLAQSLEIVGERWSLLIIRDTAFGIRRFDDIQKSLGIARNILTQRLSKLTNEGILVKARGKAGRMEYQLTDKGWDLQPLLLSLFQWGEKYQPHPKGERMCFVDRTSGNPIQPMAVRSSDGRLLKSADVWAKRGPGLNKEIVR